MAAYTLIVDTFNGTFINSITFNAIGGDGLSSGNPFVMQVGDTLAIQNDYTQQINPGTAFNGALDIIGWTTGYWNSTSSLLSFANTTSTARTILAAAAGNTLTLSASADQGGNALAGSDEFFIEVAAASITAPTANNVTVDNLDDDQYTATFNLSAGGSGGLLQYSIEKNDATPDDWIDAATDGTTSFQADFTRTSTPGTIYAQARRSATDVSSIVSVAGRGFIAPDLGITLSEGSSLLIGSSDTSFVVTVADGNSNDQYQVRDSSGTQHETVIGNGAITVTDLPSGGSEAYTIFGRRPTGSGGSNSYSTTSTSITVTQQSGSGIVPPVIQSITNDNPNSSNVTATVNLTSPGSGGTLNYAQTTGNSVPSSGWGTGNTFTHPRNTTRYYWASQSTNTVGAYDSASHFVGSYSASVYGIQVFNASGNLTMDVSDRVSGIVSRGSLSVTTGTTNVGGAVPQYEGTSSAISFTGMTTTNDDEFEVWISGDIPTAQFGLTNFVINRGTNSYTVTYRSYTASETISAPYFNVRY